MPLPDPNLPPAERDAILDRIATEVVRRRLEAPAVLCLEAHRPLQFILSQGLVVFTPMLAMLFGAAPLEKLAALMQDRENLDRLLYRIERAAQQRGSSELSPERPTPNA
jgi:hypothetical protein